MPRLSAGLALLCSLALAGRGDTAPAGAGHSEHDDCEANFIAFVGQNAYQFSPRHDGALGTVRLFSVLSNQRAVAHKQRGRAFWRLEISGPDKSRAVVFATQGVAPIDDATGRAIAEYEWDGRDQHGQLVANGAYHYTFKARFLPDRAAAVAARGGYDQLGLVREVTEADASSRDVIVNDALSTHTASAIRESLAASTCQTQQNTPIEPGLGYNFYYGSTHSHSNSSDGGYPTNACSSGNAYGSGTFDPADVYDYARNMAGMDYWLINEHNHLINDSVATNNAPVTEAKVKQRYQDGRSAATAATQDGAFVALYGMEWGVLSNSDQGHVTLIETPKLFGWETCTGCNGPNPECTPGTNCYFDVFTPKRYGYLSMYAASVANPSPAGALGVMCHPGQAHFDNYAFNANADNALQGIAVRSGLAFNTAVDCSDANVATFDYSPQWTYALNKGFHLGPVADHDAHCNTYGQGIPTRTVYLLPNNVSPALTKTALLQAHRARHFFASEDSNAQLVFATSTGGRIMGDIFSAAGSVTLRAAAYDPDGEGLATLELWRGQIGAGQQLAAYKTWSNQNSFSSSETGSGTWYYFVHAIQADGHDLWSAPMWITFGAGGDTTAPTTSITAPVNGATVSGTVQVTASASDNVGVTKVEFYRDGALQSSSTGAPYSWSFNTTGVGNGAHTLQSKAYDAAGNVGSSALVTVTVSNGAVTVFYDGAESSSTTLAASSITTSTVWTRQNSSPYAGAWRWRGGGSTGGDYGLNGDARLTTPSLNLSGAATATLSYAYKYSTEYNYDFFQVRISSDGGTNWTTLLTTSGTSTGYSAWAGVKSISLNSYVGKTVKIQFRLTSDYSINAFGVSLDEIKVVKQ